MTVKMSWALLVYQEKNCYTIHKTDRVGTYDKSDNNAS